MSVSVETRVFRAPPWLKRHETLLAIILLIALAGLGAFNDRFLTVDNLLDQGRFISETGLIALPMTFIIITGGIDLSVGAIVGLCAIMLGYSWKNFGFPLPLAIAFALAVGALAGFVNGLVITRVKVPPLIMTIATLALYRGLAEGVSQARSVRGYPEWFYFLGQGSVFGVPTQLLVLIVLIVDRGRRARPHDLWPHALRDRRERDGGALLGSAGRSGETHRLHAVRPGFRPRRLGPRLAGDDHADGYGHRLRARRHRRCRSRRRQHLWRLRHHLGHRDRPRHDPAPQERSGVDGGQGRRDNRRHRRRAESRAGP